MFIVFISIFEDYEMFDFLSLYLSLIFFIIIILLLHFVLLRHIRSVAEYEGEGEGGADTHSTQEESS
jgi:hypothetical protein